MNIAVVEYKTEIGRIRDIPIAEWNIVQILNKKDLVAWLTRMGYGQCGKDSEYEYYANNKVRISYYQV